MINQAKFSEFCNLNRVKNNLIKIFKIMMSNNLLENLLFNYILKYFHHFIEIRKIQELIQELNNNIKK